MSVWEAGQGSWGNGLREAAEDKRAMAKAITVSPFGRAGGVHYHDSFSFLGSGRWWSPSRNSERLSDHLDSSCSHGGLD